MMSVNEKNELLVIISMALFFALVVTIYELKNAEDTAWSMAQLARDNAKQCEALQHAH